MSHVKILALEYEGPNPMGVLHAALGGITIPAISLWQPYATLIGIKEKRIETRGWSTDTRGWVAIHAAKTTRGIRDLDDDFVEGHRCIGSTGIHYHYEIPGSGSKYELRSVKGDGKVFGLPLGCVVAVARLTACERMTPALIDLVPELEQSYGCYEPDRFMWMLEDAQLLTRPVPCAGRQGWFKWNVSRELEGLISG